MARPKQDTSVTKRPYQKTAFTRTEYRQLARCVTDPMYFMRKFMKIQHPLRGAIPFKPYPFQEHIIKSFADNRFTIALTARQMGKSLALDTPILTPDGFVQLGDLNVGDTIYGQDGKPAKISFITDTMYDHKCYTVKFAHGETFVADEGHLWNIRLPTRKGEIVTVDTGKMKELYARYKSISIEISKPIQFSDNETIIEPYVFGCWLGDGSSADGRITCSKDDYYHYADKFNKKGFSVSEFRPDKRRPNTGNFNVVGLRSKLRINNLSKTIPNSMIFTSVENRLELLRGLMDTDGTVEKNGVCRFYQSNKEFIEQVRILLSSLGIKSTLRVKKTYRKDCFILTFCTTQKVCSIPRKLERMSEIKNHPKNTRFYISEISETNSVPVRCLQVDNKDHLFLAGKTLVPTHNTTCAAGFLLWKAMFTPDTTILVAANKFVQALEIMDRIRYAYENMPDFLRAGVTEYNKGTLTFDNGSKIVSRATSTDAGRGLSITLLYCDEFAFVHPNKAEAFWTSIQPILSTGGSCIITSTPKSDEDQFAQIWKGAINNTDEFGNPRDNDLGINDFYAVKVPWWEHPERDELWAKPFRESLGPARFAQEFECEFVTDDETLINPLTLSRMQGTSPEFYTGTVRWFKEPEPNKTYIAALDPCVGTGYDYAAIQVYELPNMTQIAEWQHNQTAPRQQVAQLMKILFFIDQTLRDDPHQMGDPEIFWTIENNGLGEAILQIIEDTGEERFPGSFVSEKKRKGQSRRFRKGLNTDNRKKLSACARAKSLIESDRMTIKSGQLIKELKTFVSLDNSFGAKSGSHDDLVCAMLLCIRMLDVVLGWSNHTGDLREFIDEDELFSDEDMPMPVVI